MNDSSARSRLAQLIRDNAVMRESVLLPSGRRSSFHVDAGQVLWDPEGASLAGTLAWQQVGPWQPQAVGGLSPDSAPLVCAVTAAAQAADRRVQGFAVRTEARKHGLQQWIDGPFVEEGTPVVLLHDVLVSGESLSTSAQRARQAGADLRGALVLIDRGDGGRDTAADALGDVPLVVMFTADELLGDDR